MKKFASLFLALVMVCSLSVSAFAAHTTTVTYTGTSSESYTLTVPATLTPGASGEVKASGTWASNRTLVVTAPNTVTLTNDIDGGTKTLDVTFEGINQAGNDTVAQTVTKNITVGNISNALFGTWSGVITYNVNMEDNGSLENNGYTVFFDADGVSDDLTVKINGNIPSYQFGMNVDTSYDNVKTLEFRAIGVSINASSKSWDIGTSKNGNDIGTIRMLSGTKSNTITYTMTEDTTIYITEKDVNEKV